MIRANTGAEVNLQFTGSYSYSGFRSCIPINPWDKRMTAKAIHQVCVPFNQRRVAPDSPYRR